MCEKNILSPTRVGIRHAGQRGKANWDVGRVLWYNMQYVWWTTMNFIFPA